MKLHGVEGDAKVEKIMAKHLLMGYKPVIFTFGPYFDGWFSFLPYPQPGGYRPNISALWDFYLNNRSRQTFSRM